MSRELVKKNAKSSVVRLIFGQASPYLILRCTANSSNILVCKQLSINLLKNRKEILHVFIELAADNFQLLHRKLTFFNFDILGCWLC